MAQNLDTAKQWVKESDAEMLVFRVVAYSGTEEILRGWPASKIPKDKLEICKAYLISRGSEKNNKQSWTIKDPQVDKEEWTGTWQHYDEGWQVFNRQLYLTQTIRKGYYQDIPYQTTEISGDRTVSTRQQLRLTTETPEPIVAVAGQVKSQSVRLNEEDGTKTIHTDKDVGTAQEVINTIRAPDATTVITEKTVQDAQVTVPALQDGILKRIRNVWSKYYNRWTTTEETETGIAQTATTTTNLTGTERTVVTEKTVQDTALTVAEFAQGTIRRIVNLVSKYPSRFTTVEDVKTTIPASVNEYIAHIGDRTTVYHSEEKHATAAPNIMTYKNSAGETKTATLDAQGNPLDADGKSVDLSILSHNLDDFLTRNYTKSRTVKKFPISDADNVEGISWPVYGDMETVTIQENAPATGIPYVERVYKYQIIDTYTMRYFTSAKAARDWIVSKNSTSILPDDPLATGFSSGLKTKYDENNLSTFHGSGTEWTAIAVVRTRSLRYTYRYDPPD